MLSWFKIIIFMFKRTFFIFHKLVTFLDFLEVLEIIMIKKQFIKRKEKKIY